MHVIRDNDDNKNNNNNMHETRISQLISFSRAMMTIKDTVLLSFFFTSLMVLVKPLVCQKKVHVIIFPRPAVNKSKIYIHAYA